MKGIVSIIESYLEARKSNTFETIEFRTKLFRLGCSKEEVEDLLLKMDDEWTIEILFDLDEKKASKNLRGSYISVVLGLFLTVFSSLDFVLFNGKAMYLAYGAIIGGVTSIVISKRALRSLKQQQKIRKLTWEYWIENKENNLNVKLKKNIPTPKQTINDMFS
jgi:hypothetical protein